MRNLTSILVLGCFLVGIFGCVSKDDCCVIIDTNVQILYKNEAGENLINSNSNFDESNIKIYYKNGDDFEYVYKGNLDAPNMFRIDADPNGNTVLTIFPSNYYEGNRSTTLVELNQNVIDTLVCEFELDNTREICKRGWLNGVEMNNRFLEVER